jgi:2-phosphoglycerate kinase
MVILIGGSSRVGKTKVAHHLIRKLGFECVSLDVIKEAFCASQVGNPGERSDYEMRYWMWPFVSQMIRKAVQDGRNIIFEGCYIPAEWAESFKSYELSEIRCVFIVMSESYLRSHEDQVRSHANDVERRRSDEMDIERLITCSQEFKEDCIRTGTFYIEIDGEYDEDSLYDAVESVIEDDDYLEKGIIL